MIKPKIGKCADCPPGSSDKPLTAGRCNTHYWQHRAKVNAKKPAAKAKQEKKSELTVWYDDQLTMRPKCCENCSASLAASMVINPRTVVCHIIGKSHFPEVATHPLNRWFGCSECHDWYDKNPGEINHMPVFDIVRKRFLNFRDEVLMTNWYKIPDPLKLTDGI